MIHICNPSTWRCEAGESLWVQSYSELRDSVAYTARALYRKQKERASKSDICFQLFFSFLGTNHQKK